VDIVYEALHSALLFLSLHLFLVDQSYLLDASVTSKFNDLELTATHILLQPKQCFRLLFEDLLKLK
jgi:hypothetical protein